jgi:hypothetical protein
MVVMVASFSDAGQQESVDVAEVFVECGEGKTVSQGGGSDPEVIGGYRPAFFLQGPKYRGIKIRSLLIEV